MKFHLIKIRHKTYSAGSDTQFLLPGKSNVNKGSSLFWSSLSVCLMSLPFFPVCIVMPVSILEACLLKPEDSWSLLLHLCNRWSWSVDFHRRLCFWYALHSVGCLLSSLVGMAENGCMLLQLSVSSAWMFWACELCQLHRFRTVGIWYHCGMGKMYWSPLTRKRPFLNKVRAEIGSPLGQGHGAIDEGQFSFSHLRSDL